MLNDMSASDCLLVVHAPDALLGDVERSRMRRKIATVVQTGGRVYYAPYLAQKETRLPDYFPPGHKEVSMLQVPPVRGLVMQINHSQTILAVQRMRSHGRCAPEVAGVGPCTLFIERMLSRITDQDVRDFRARFGAVCGLLPDDEQALPEYSAGLQVTRPHDLWFPLDLGLMAGAAAPTSFPSRGSPVPMRRAS